MKANEFVKEHGIKKTKSICDRYFGYTHVTNDARMLISEKDYVEFAPHFKSSLSDAVKISDLKRLVESHEIIKLFKSLDHAKVEAQACEHSKHSEILVKLDVGVGYIWLSRVKQAIADVESCQ